MAARRKLKNRFLILLTEKERKLGRRIPQSEVAREIDVANNTILNWIKNDLNKFDRVVVESLCEYFECEIGDLLYMEIVFNDSSE